MAKEFTIKRRDDGAVIFSGNFETMRECVEDALYNHVALWGANLFGADLNGAIGIG